jgi:hypothetical protein
LGEEMTRKKILAWEMWGILFIFLVGALLHFVFELSGGLRLVAIIGGVNESVWEHLKIGFWPAFVWALIEFFVFGKRTKNFLIAKGVSFTSIALLITGIFYASRAMGVESLAIDIANFFVSIAIAQTISYRLVLVQRGYKALNIIGVILIVANLVAFSLLTYFPPKCPIFLDPISGGYGIVQ